MKSALIQKLSAQTPKIFNQHGIAEKSKKLYRQLCSILISLTIKINLPQQHFLYILQQYQECLEQ